MPVANEKIIHKMMEELKSAQETPHDENRVNKHVEKVRLLCDLLLDEDGNTAPATPKPHSATNEFSDMEIKAMLGKQTASPKPQQTTNEFSDAELKAMLGNKKSTLQQPAQQKRLTDEDANGDSLFDF